MEEIIFEVLSPILDALFEGFLECLAQGREDFQPVFPLSERPLRKGEP